MLRAIRLSTKSPWIVILFFIGLAVAGFKFGSPAKVTSDLVDILPENHPAVERYKNFKRTYEVGDLIAITYSSPNLFNREGLSLIRNLTTSIEGISGISGATSLTSIQLPNVVNEGVEFAKLVPDDDITTISDTGLAQIRDKAMTNLLVSGNLLNKDGTTTAIIAETKANLSKTEQREALSLVKSEIDKIKATGADLHISSSGLVEMEVERLQSKLIAHFGTVTAVATFAWFFMTLGSLSLAATGAIFAATNYLLSAAAVNLLNINFDLINSLAPAVMVSISVAIVTPILIQFQRSIALGGNKEEAIATSFLVRQSHLVTLGAGIALIAVANFLTGFVPLRAFALMMATSLGISGISALVLLPAMLAIDITVVPSHRNVKIRESIKNMIRGLGLPNQLLMSAILLTLVAMTGFGIFSLKGLPFETTPVRFLQNSNATQKELVYFNSMLGGPEMIDVEATLKDPSQNFFLSSPLKTLNEVQKRFGDRFQASVSRSVSIADYFKELHKAFTPGVTAENSMPEKEEDYKNYADLLELSDGKMLGKMLTIDKSRARMMISRRLVGWDVPDANAFIDEEIPKIARGEMDFKVAGLAGFIRELDKICRSHSEGLMYGFALMLALVAGVASRSLAMAGIMSSVTLLSYGVPMIGAKLIGIPLDMSTVVGQSSIALVCLTAMGPIIASFRRPKSKHGDSSRSHLWQAAVDGAPEVLASAPLIGIICASLWFSGIWAFGRLGFLVFGSAVCAASVLAILLPLMTRTHDSQNASSSKRENEQRRSHAA